MAAVKKRYIVYRFLNSFDEIIYVGKTKRFHERIMSHLRGNSNIPIECRDEIDRIQFLEFQCEADMDLFEIYCICYYKPKYNSTNKSDVGTIKIDIPRAWNELIIETFDEITRTPIIGASEKGNIENFHFNKEAFLNEELSSFLKNNCNKQLSESEKQELCRICKLESFDFDKLNDYIHYNNSRFNLETHNKTYFLKEAIKGKDGYGSWKKTKSGGLGFSISLRNNKKKTIYGSSKEEIADKIEKFIQEAEGVPQIPDVEKESNKRIEGINKLLYENKNEPLKLLTKEEVMENLHIKNIRTFNKLINDGLPHIKIGRKILIPNEKYKKWINSRVI